MPQQLAKADLEALLRARKLDHTLPSPFDEAFDEQATVGTGFAELDRRLAGGLPRGQMSEIVGARSSGRMSLLLSTLASATARGEAAAVVDPLDMLDPPSAAENGVDLSHLLWIRGVAAAATPADDWFHDTRGRRSGGDAQGPLIERALDRAVKALNLVLQAGGFGVVALDLGEVPPASVRKLPFTTWLRLERVIEGSQTVCLLIGNETVARSAGGVTLLLDRAESGAGIEKAGDSLWLRRDSQAALFLGLEVGVRIVRAHWRADETPCRIRIGQAAGGGREAGRREMRDGKGGEVVTSSSGLRETKYGLRQA